MEVFKVFDTVDHESLLIVFYFYGFRREKFGLALLFLSNRFLFVEVNQQRSSSSEVKIGVPQGSTFFPHQFLLYSNDLNKTLTMLKSIHFANDATPYLDTNPSKERISLIDSESAQMNFLLVYKKLTTCIYQIETKLKT